VEEVIADYAERWRGHAAMQQWEYRLDYLDNYIARYTGRTSNDVYAEMERRMEAL
jgi:hypothetical protein